MSIGTILNMNVNPVVKVHRKEKYAEIKEGLFLNGLVKAIYKARGYNAEFVNEFSPFLAAKDDMQKAYDVAKKLAGAQMKKSMTEIENAESLEEKTRKSADNEISSMDRKIKNTQAYLMQNHREKYNF